MSKALSLKMDDQIFEETEGVLKKIKMPRNAYINRAIDFYNRYQKRVRFKKILAKDIKLLKEDTQRLIKSYELLEDLP